MNTSKIMKFLRLTLLALLVPVLLVVLVLIPLFGAIPYIPPEPVKQENVAEISFTTEEGYGYAALGHERFTASEDDRDFFLSIIDGAWRVPINRDEYKPTYGELYPIYLTIDIKLKEESKSYKFLFYNHKDYSLLHGETEYKLALVRQEGEQSKMWVLPHNACYTVKAWYNDWCMERFG